MKASHFFMGFALISGSCSKERISPPTTHQPTSVYQITGTVVSNTCYCTNSWEGTLPAIIELDQSVSLPLFVYSTNLPDSFRIPGTEIKFDMELARSSRFNWCDGIPLPEEAQLSNVKFE